MFKICQSRSTVKVYIAPPMRTRLEEFNSNNTETRLNYDNLEPSSRTESLDAARLRLCLIPPIESIGLEKREKLVKQVYDRYKKDNES